MTTLTSVGYGNIAANTVAEQSFCVVVLIFGGEYRAISCLDCLFFLEFLSSYYGKALESFMRLDLYGRKPFTDCR